MTETKTIPLDQIKPHPSNPRRAAAADDALVESIRRVGLQEPLQVVPHGDIYLLIDGHRRSDGCRRAGLTTVDCRVRDDLVTEAQQVEVMAITGLQKELLSPVEEAAAYEQLTLLGMDEAAIAKATGYTKARVKQRLRLAGLNQDVQTAVHTGQATLVDVDALLEFADDIEATKELEQALGTRDFGFTLARVRSRRTRAERHARIVAEFEDLGAVRADPDRDTTKSLHAYPWNGTDLADPAAHTHTECLGYIDNGPDSYAEPRLVCLNPDSHDTPDQETGEVGRSDADREAEQVEWERKEAARAAEQERQAAAAAARQEWLIEHFTGLFPAKGNTALTKTLAGFLPALVGDPRFADLFDYNGEAQVVLGLDKPDRRPSWDGFQQSRLGAALELTVAKPPVVVGVFARMLALWCSSILDNLVVDDDELPTVLWLWDWLAASGYPMSSVDTEQHMKLSQRAAETDDEDDDEAES